MKSRPTALAAALTAVLALSLSACGGDDGGSRTAPETKVTATPEPTDTASASPSPSPSATPNTKTIAIKIEGKDISPDGASIKVKAGQPVTLKIQSDRAGELHVHSTPEEEIAFPAGASVIARTFDKPGVIAIEDHALDKLIVQLEVS